MEVLNALVRGSGAQWMRCHHPVYSAVLLLKVEVTGSVIHSITFSEVEEMTSSKMVKSLITKLLWYYYSGIHH